MAGAVTLTSWLYASLTVARVGGIPSRDAAGKHPLGYMITWAFEHVLREYMVKVKVIKNGEVVEVDAASDLERFRFAQFGKKETLECAITRGCPASSIHGQTSMSLWKRRSDGRGIGRESRF